MSLHWDLLDIGLILLRDDGQIDICNQWVSARARLRSSALGLQLEDAFGQNIDPSLLQARDNALKHGRSSRLSHAFHPMPLPLYALRGAAQERIHHSVDVIAGAENGKRFCMLQIRDLTETIRRETLLKRQSLQLANDLAELRHTQEDLARHTLRFREMTRLAPVGLFETDMQGRLTYFNDRCVEMLGLNTLRDLGQEWTSTLPAETAGPLFAHWRVAAESATRLSEEFCLPGKPGQADHWLRLEAGPIRNADTVPVGFLCTLIDVTELHERAQRSEFRANHDPLTSLPNRRRFELRLRAALAGAQAVNESVVVVVIDLDGFKEINDAHGHAAGDLVLQTVATRMRKTLRNDDMVARMGGDEFALLFPEAPGDEQLALLLSKLSQAVGMPVNWQRQRLRVSCSIGIARYPDDAQDLARLMEHADRAMYAHKRRR